MCICKCIYSIIASRGVAHLVFLHLHQHLPPHPPHHFAHSGDAAAHCRDRALAEGRGQPAQLGLVQRVNGPRPE